MKKLTIELCQRLAISRGGKCLSLEYINARTLMEWECNTCNNKWSTSLTAVKNNNTWCRYCRTRASANNIRKDFNIFNKIAKDHGGKCTSNKEDYQNNKSMLTFQCAKDHIWRVRAAHIVRGSWCSVCNTVSSKPEKQVRSIFEAKFNKEFPTIRPNFLKNPETEYNLELDGYCEELRLAFEYDGEQHYKEWTLGSDSLKDRQNRDKLKNKLCKNKGITLIRIPYWEKDNLENFIDRELNGYK
jgi:hypothetical protein